MTLGARTGDDVLRSGGLLLLFDGLDEVSGAHRRAAVAERIAALAGFNDGTNRVAVTSRTRAWEEGRGKDAGFAAFAEAQLLPLGSAEIARFLEGWCGACFEGDPSRARDIAGRMLSDIESQPRVREMASNPQMLSMLAQLYVNDGRLPAHRATLIGRCVDHLLETRQAELPGGVERTRRMLVRLAVRLMESGRERLHPAEPVDVIARWPSGRKRPLVEPGLHGEAYARDAAREALHQVEVLTGLLRADDGGYGFAHRTFLEYLAATKFSRDDVAAALDAHLGETAWKEVVGLSLGLYAKERGPEALERVLAKLAGSKPAREADVPSYAARPGTLAAARDDIEGAGVAQRAFAPVAAALNALLQLIEDPDTPRGVRVQVAEGFGRTHDLRLTRENRWVELPAGAFWRGAAPGDPDAHRSERPAARVELPAFAIQRWPTTVAEFAEFIAAGGYDQSELWSPEGWAWRTRTATTTPLSWDAQSAHRNRPVGGVTWWEAEAYCQWLQTTLGQTMKGRIVRLPSETEWERAARGTQDERRFPWGNVWDDRRANAIVYGSGPATWSCVPVGLFPDGCSPDGLWDMCGCIGQLCARPVLGYVGDGAVYRFLTTHGPEGREVRGGPWATRADCRLSHRAEYDVDEPKLTIAFRPVKAGRLPDWRVPDALRLRRIDADLAGLVNEAFEVHVQPAERVFYAYPV